MTPQIAQAHLTGITENMNSNFIFEKATLSPEMANKDFTDMDYNTVSVLFGETNEDLIIPKGTDIEYLAEHRNNTVTIIGFQFDMPTLSFRDTVYSYMIKAQFHDLLRKEMKVGRFSNIDCSILSLFMASTISWEEFVEATRRGCDI